ncbi:hypothetical protein GC176_27420 [bacterium]|nr:hypothetical protein [bacterium]
MAEENAAQQEVNTSAAPAGTPRKGGMLKVMINVALAMVGEAALFFFLGIGSNASGPELSAAESQAGKEDEERRDDEQDALAEVEIHTFNVTNNTAAADSIIHISFKLYALVAADQKSAFDRAANEENKARVREAVERIARGATVEDLNDPAAGTLKRLLREEINKVLKQSYIVEVVLSDFKTMQQ